MRGGSSTSLGAEDEARRQANPTFDSKYHPSRTTEEGGSSAPKLVLDLIGSTMLIVHNILRIFRSPDQASDTSCGESAQSVILGSERKSLKVLAGDGLSECKQLNCFKLCNRYNGFSRCHPRSKSSYGL